jgi:hypothetical protein
LSKARIRPEVLVSRGNARTSLHGRNLMVAQHQGGWEQAHLAAATGISRPCARATWVTRQEGEPGSPTPPTRPHTTVPGVHLLVSEGRHATYAHTYNWRGAAATLQPPPGLLPSMARAGTGPVVLR